MYLFNVCVCVMSVVAAGVIIFKLTTFLEPSSRTRTPFSALVVPVEPNLLTSAMCGLKQILACHSDLPDTPGLLAFGLPTETGQ